MSRVHGSTAAAAAEPTCAHALDPVENISAQPSPTYEKGMYRRQYRAAARNGIWGREGATCGAGVLEKREDGELAVIPILCDTWACPLCGPRKAAWLIRELAAAQKRYRLDYFWTLTVWTEQCAPEASYALVKHWWDNLSRRLRREHGSFSFVWIQESTKAGYAHLHLFTSLDVPQAELSAMWLEVTGGSFIVDVEPVSSERASSYLAKYCTEQARLRAEPGYEHLKGKRFFSKSRDVQFAPFRTEGAREEVIDFETGEVRHVSQWRRRDVPYWERVEHLAARGLVAQLVQVHGVPRIVYRE